MAGIKIKINIFTLGQKYYPPTCLLGHYSVLRRLKWSMLPSILVKICLVFAAYIYMYCFNNWPVVYIEIYNKIRLLYSPLWFSPVALWLLSSCLLVTRGYVNNRLVLRGGKHVWLCSFVERLIVCLLDIYCRHRYTLYANILLVSLS